ncbi:hypothetical protein F4604DRAFT_861443 [Suillus subluteus]|nr:hypothetical protein F4604DRAFT_861443 [Suillus subluteus]
MRSKFCRSFNCLWLFFPFFLHQIESFRVYDPMLDMVRHLHLFLRMWVVGMVLLCLYESDTYSDSGSILERKARSKFVNSGSSCYHGCGGLEAATCRSSYNLKLALHSGTTEGVTDHCLSVTMPGTSIFHQVTYFRVNAN